MKTNLNQAIGKLVQRGLPEKIQKALDTIRVIGNNAIHPGKINVNDNPEIAESLFGLVNFICEKMIKEEREIETLFNNLPQGQRNAIGRRDSHEISIND